MSRTLWFVAGAATSAYAIAKARRAAEALTPEGLRDRLAGVRLGAHLLGEEVRAEATAKEADLRERLGLGPQLTADTTPALEPAGADQHDPRHLHLTRKGST